jgi:flagellar protein FliL
MIRKLIPILLALVGLGGGLGAGVMLRPGEGAAHDGGAADAGADHPTESDDQAEASEEDASHAEGEVPATEYVKMNNQFVIPVIEDGHVVAMVVLSLSLEVSGGATEMVYSKEPKLRDAFLQVLFDHANVGGFKGSFTDTSNLIVLRNSLTEAAVVVMGDVVKDILITDIGRQDT